MRLFQLLFGLSGRVDRNKFWMVIVVSGVTFIVGGLIFAAIAVSAFGLHRVSFRSGIPGLIFIAPLSVRRLHDRDKSAWWVLVFYVVPGALSHFANVAWLAGTVGTALCFILALTGLALLIWGFVEIGSLRGTAGPNRCGANSLAARNLNSVRSATP